MRPNGKRLARTFTAFRQEIPVDSAGGGRREPESLPGESCGTTGLERERDEALADIERAEKSGCACRRLCRSFRSFRGTGHPAARLRLENRRVAGCGSDGERSDASARWGRFTAWKRMRRRQRIARSHCGGRGL